MLCLYIPLDSPHNVHMQYHENLMTHHGSGMKLAGDKSYHFQTEAVKIWSNFIDPWRENWVISEAACGQKIQ